jgi:hypothetical protein
MIIASAKRRENIAEYLIYMWHIEDLIRAHDLDIDKIKCNVISRFNVDDAQKREMEEWYESLIDMMRREGVAKSGHLRKFVTLGPKKSLMNCCTVHFYFIPLCVLVRSISCIHITQQHRREHGLTFKSP